MWIIRKCNYIILLLFNEVRILQWKKIKCFKYFCQNFFKNIIILMIIMIKRKNNILIIKNNINKINDLLVILQFLSIIFIIFFVESIWEISNIDIIFRYLIHIYYKNLKKSFKWKVKRLFDLKIIIFIKSIFILKNNNEKY